MLFEPREFTPGMWFRLYLEREKRTQTDVLHALERKQQNQPGRSRGWSWTLTMLALDKKRLTREEYEAVAAELQLSPSETLRFLRSADIPPLPEEVTRAVQAVRPFMSGMPWPAYITSYRLDHIIAWNGVTALLYQLGPASAGPDLPERLPSGTPRVDPVRAAQLNMVSTLFDPAGPLRPLLEAAGHDAWEKTVRQQMAYFLSYWEPLRLWGVPDWMKATLIQAERYPEFRDMWKAAQIDRLHHRLGTESGTTLGSLYDCLEPHVASCTMLFEVHPLIIDPRLELLIQLPANRATALAFLELQQQAAAQEEQIMS